MTLITQIELAGLGGRGGAGFPTARKLLTAKNSGADLIVNACDGELGSGKDGVVVRHYGAELLAGVQLVAAEIGARSVLYAAHRGSDTADELARLGVQVLGVPHRYVSSEETSLIRLAAGDVAKPLSKRGIPAAGLTAGDGTRYRPTLVLNAETVLRIAQITQQGPEWFHSHGTDADPGPKLVTIGGAVSSPGVYEVSARHTVHQVLQAAGGAHRDAQHVIIGGLGGGWAQLREVSGRQFSAEGLRSNGVRPGAGVIQVIDPDRCPVQVLVETLEFAAGETAGQCGPCMFGLPQLARDARTLLHDPTRQLPLQQRLPLLTGRGSCHFPDGVASYTGTALRVLSDHLAAHRSGQCPSRRRMELTV